MFNKINILFLLVLQTVSGISQNAVAEYKKIINAQKKSEYVSLNIDVVAYETRNDKTPEVIGKGVLKKSKDISYSKYNEQEMLYGEKYTLVINNDIKTIDYYEHEKGPRPKMKNNYLSLIDSTLADMGEGFKYEGVKDNLKHFSVSTPEDIIERTDFYFGNSDNLLAKIVYSYGPSTDDYETGVALAIINYKNYSFDKITINSDKSYYIVKNGDTWVGVNKYKGFKVKFFKG